jgi:hypothetical protein
MQAPNNYDPFESSGPHLRPPLTDAHFAPPPDPGREARAVEEAVRANQSLATAALRAGERQQRIAELAFEIARRKGFPRDSTQADWLEAERELVRQEAVPDPRAARRPGTRSHDH